MSRLPFKVNLPKIVFDTVGDLFPGCLYLDVLEMDVLKFDQMFCRKLNLEQLGTRWNQDFMSHGLVNTNLKILFKFVTEVNYANSRQ
jgi:hypothetical protein